MTDVLNVTGVKVASPGVLEVTWNDGVTRRVDLRARMSRHPVLEMLAIPEVFRDVTVVPGGGGVGWANGADFSARSLRIWSDEEIAMNARKSA